MIFHGPILLLASAVSLPLIVAPVAVNTPLLLTWNVPLFIFILPPLIVPPLIVEPLIVPPLIVLPIMVEPLIVEAVIAP